MTRAPFFSLLHPTARLPGGWIPAERAWLQAADFPQDVEHILAIDLGYAGIVDRPQEFPDGRKWLETKVAWNAGNRDSTAAWNIAARRSEGEILIQIADDLYPSKGWDTELRAVLDSTRPQALNLDFGGGLRREFAPFAILTRAYYRELGNRICWPEYQSMYADDDFTLEALSRGVMEEAPWIKWEHRHLGTDADEVYRHQNSTAHYRIGWEVFQRRWPQAAKRKGPPPCLQAGI